MEGTYNICFINTKMTQLRNEVTNKINEGPNHWGTEWTASSNVSLSNEITNDINGGHFPYRGPLSIQRATFHTEGHFSSIKGPLSKEIIEGLFLLKEDLLY